MSTCVSYWWIGITIKDLRKSTIEIWKSKRKYNVEIKVWWRWETEIEDKIVSFRLSCATSPSNKNHQNVESYSSCDLFECLGSFLSVDMDSIHFLCNVYYIGVLSTESVDWFEGKHYCMIKYASSLALYHNNFSEWKCSQSRVGWLD